MLQISQIEKPRCSATIDQMRLRRAMNLPLEFQYFSFSGSQSEIHVVFRSLMRGFLSERARRREQKKSRPRALESVLPQGGSVACPVVQGPAAASAVTDRVLRCISSFVPTLGWRRKMQEYQKYND